MSSDDAPFYAPSHTITHHARASPAAGDDAHAHPNPMPARPLLFLLAAADAIPRPPTTSISTITGLRMQLLLPISISDSFDSRKIKAGRGGGAVSTFHRVDLSLGVYVIGLCLDPLDPSIPLITLARTPMKFRSRGTSWEEGPSPGVDCFLGAACQASLAYPILRGFPKTSFVSFGRRQRWGPSWKSPTLKKAYPLLLLFRDPVA